MKNEELNEELCRECYYYEEIGNTLEGLESGLCHRFPPSCPPVDLFDGDFINSFPVVLSASWCGEWKEISNP